MLVFLLSIASFFLFISCNKDEVIEENFSSSITAKVEALKNQLTAQGTSISITDKQALEELLIIHSEEEITPKLLISKEEAIQMQQHWKNTKGIMLRKAIGKEMISDFWWSLDDLEDYIRYVKQLAKKDGVRDLGIRFYLGAYPSNHPIKPNKTNLFIAPTLSNGTTYKAANPMNRGSGGEPPKTYPE